MALTTIPPFPVTGVTVSLGSDTTNKYLAVAAITSVPVGSRVPLGFVLAKSAARAPLSAVEAAARALIETKKPALGLPTLPVVALSPLGALPAAVAPTEFRSARGVVTTNVSNLAAFTGVAGGARVDGLFYLEGQRSLLVGQTNQTQNGPWVVGAVAGGAAPLTRPTDWAAASVVLGAQIFKAAEGDVGADTTWVLKTPTPVTVDTTPVVFQNPLAPSFTPDAPGPYGVIVYNVRARQGAPTFLGDPVGDARFDLVSTDTGTVDVGGNVDIAVETARGDGATLRLQVNGTTVRAASLVAPLNEKSKVAIEQAAVVTAIANLVGQTATAVGPTIATTATDLRTKYEAHRILVAAHATIDSTNTVPRTEANSLDGAVKLAALLYDAVVAHLTTGSSAANSWHKDAPGNNHDDFKNLPITTKPTTLAQVTVALADLRYRVYERHRTQVASPAAHPASDATNTLTAATLLDTAIVAYLDALALESPTAPTGEALGLIQARHLYGFR